MRRNIGQCQNILTRRVVSVRLFEGDYLHTKGNKPTWLEICMDYQRRLLALPPSPMTSTSKTLFEGRM